MARGRAQVGVALHGATIVLAPLVLAVAFRHLPEWRQAWRPRLATAPAILVANVVFSTLGNGAATRAGTVVWFLWVAYLGVLLIRKGEESRVRTAV
jgi:hypothetical protein